jgi:hypothetical protein
MTLTSEPGLAGAGQPGRYQGSAPDRAAGPPAGPGPAAPDSPAAPVQTCWMCGIRLPAALMVPDGGAGCPDIRWYCQDAGPCTARWTQRRP